MSPNMLKARSCPYLSRFLTSPVPVPLRRLPSTWLSLPLVRPPSQAMMSWAETIYDDGDEDEEEQHDDDDDDDDDGDGDGDGERGDDDSDAGDAAADADSKEDDVAQARLARVEIIGACSVSAADVASDTTRNGHCPLNLSCQC